MNPPPQPAAVPTSGDRRWLLPGLGLIVGAVALSFLPLHTKVELHTKGRLHYIGHFLIFGAVGFALTRAARSSLERAAALATALSFGLLIEYAEHRVYRSPLEWRDVLVDAIAVSLAAAIASLRQ